MATKPEFRDRRAKSLRLYLAEAPRSRITQDEANLLKRRALAGDDAARVQFIVEHLGLVIATALKYRNMGIAKEDLIQEGNLLLCEPKHWGSVDREGNTFTYLYVVLRTRFRHLLYSHRGVVDLPKLSMRTLDSCPLHCVPLPPDDKRGAMAVQADDSEADEAIPATPEQARRAWSLLSEPHRTLLSLRFGSLLRLHYGIAEESAHTLSETATVLRRTEQGVQDSTLRALQKFSGYLSGKTPQAVAEEMRKVDAQVLAYAAEHGAREAAVRFGVDVSRIYGARWVRQSLRGKMITALASSRAREKEIARETATQRRMWIQARLSMLSCTKSELARRVGVSKPYISHILSGKKPASARTWEAIERALSVADAEQGALSETRESSSPVFSSASPAPGQARAHHRDDELRVLALAARQASEALERRLEDAR